MNILLAKIYYHQINNKAKFSCSSLGKAFGKQIKAIKDQGEKQVEALNTLKSNNKTENIIPKSAFASDEAKEEFDKIVKMEKTIDREKLVYNASEYTYDFRKFRTPRIFGRDIYDGKISLEEADEDQSDLVGETENFKNKTRPKCLGKKQEKKNLLIICIIFLMLERKFLMVLKAKYF